MADHAISSDPAVQRQLDRLASLSPGADVLGLERITTLCARLGNPQNNLPPVFHVAGTNGKGSTCATLRAALEAAGHRVHVYTSPHLVRFNERIRVAGQLISDASLAALLAEVLDIAEDVNASFFEVTTAAAFLAFTRTPADACVIEVGLGGRLDATNVIPPPLVGGIAALGIDHQFFLGDTIEQIAAEKAGIAKPGMPLVTELYPANVAAPIARAAEAAGAHWLPRGTAWDYAVQGDRLHVRDAAGAVDLPLPRLPGPHQAANAALAVAMLRRQDRLSVPTAALEQAMQAEWPARLQQLTHGALVNLLPPGTELRLDGGHNADGAAAVAAWLERHLGTAKGALVLGVLANKDAGQIVRLLAPHIDRLWAVPVPGHEHHAPEALAGTARAQGLAAHAAPDVRSALAAIAAGGAPDFVLIQGSLYLCGLVLAENGTPPA